MAAAYELKQDDGSILYKATYQYELDAAGYLKKQHSDFPLSGRWNDITYHFE
ncbi:MAG: hypothetical protein U0V75_10615 [Ferruginibacter sp.]